MTKTLKTLIRMHQQRLDEKRRELVQLEEDREHVIDFLNNLEKEYQKEYVVAADNPEMTYSFESYKKQVARKKQEGQETIVTLNKKIDVLSLKISEEYSELKKFDIMKNIKEEEIDKELRRKEQIDLDEMGSVAYERKRAEKE